MIQSFHRFLIDHLSSEGNTFPHNPLIFQHPSQSASSIRQTDPNSPVSLSPVAAPVTQLLGIDAKNIIVCLSCKAVREKENMTHVVDMVYPRKVRLSFLSRLILYPDRHPSPFPTNLRPRLLLPMFSARP